MFLTKTKTLPSIRFGTATYELELEEPPSDNQVMNAAREASGETPEVMAAAKKELVALLKSKHGALKLS